MWPLDVAYVKLFLNLLVIGLCVWFVCRRLEESLELRALIALTATGAAFVALGVGFLLLGGETNTARHLLLLELGIRGAGIDLGYALLAAGLIGLVRRRRASRSDDP